MIFLDVENKINIIDETMGLLDEDEDLFVTKIPVPSLNRDQLEILNRNFTISDVFVEKPFKLRKLSKKGFYLKQNYLLNRLKHLPSLPILYTLMKYVDINTYKTTNICNYVNTLAYYISCYDQLNNIKNIKLTNIIYSSIYYFYCNTYLNKTPTDDYWFDITNSKFTYNLTTRLPNNEKYKNKISKDKNVSINYVDDKNINVTFQVTIQKFMEKYSQNNPVDILFYLSREDQHFLKTHEEFSQEYYDDLFEEEEEEVELLFI